MRANQILCLHCVLSRRHQFDRTQMKAELYKHTVVSTYCVCRYWTEACYAIRLYLLDPVWLSRWRDTRFAILVVLVKVLVQQAHSSMLRYVAPATSCGHLYL